MQTCPVKILRIQAEKRIFAGMRLNRLTYFFNEGLWRIRADEVGKWQMYAYGTLKRTILTTEYFFRQELYFRAAGLTYATLLATIPILAIVFAISRGFGFNKLIEEEIRKNFRAEPQITNEIIGFVNSYLVHTRSGIFIGAGILLLFWTLISLTSNIEQTFNQIWQVKHPRSPFRVLTDYTAVFFLMPLFFVITGGLSIFVSQMSRELPDFLLLNSFLQLCITLSPFILSGLIFTGLYMFMPNTHVNWLSATKSGFLAGTVFQFLQYFYIHSQLWVTSYNAIYGSFAALPLFMLWIQFSWYICLFGAQLSFVDQHIEHFFHGRGDSPTLSRRYHDFLCLLILSFICKRFLAGKTAYTADRLASVHRIPIRLVNDILYELYTAGLLLEVGNDEKGAASSFVPARDSSTLTVGTVLNKLSRNGYEKVTDDLPDEYSELWKRFNRSYKDLLKNEQMNIRLYDLL